MSQHRLCLRWLFALSALVVLLLVASQARAGTILSVELTGPRDDLPGWVCLVNEKPKNYKAGPSEVELKAINVNVKALSDLWAQKDPRFKMALDSQGVSDACVLPDGSLRRGLRGHSGRPIQARKGARRPDPVERGFEWREAGAVADALLTERRGAVAARRRAATRPISASLPVDVIAFTAHGRTLRISIGSDIDVMLQAPRCSADTYKAGTTADRLIQRSKSLQLALEPRCVARPIPAVPVPATLQRKYYFAKGRQKRGARVHERQVAQLRRGPLMPAARS